MQLASSAKVFAHNSNERIVTIKIPLRHTNLSIARPYSPALQRSATLIRHIPKSHDTAIGGEEELPPPPEVPRNIGGRGFFVLTAACTIRYLQEVAHISTWAVGPVTAAAVLFWIWWQRQLKAMKQSALQVAPANTGATLSPRGQRALSLPLHLLRTLVLSIVLVTIVHFMGVYLLPPAVQTVRLQGVNQASSVFQTPGQELLSIWEGMTFILVMAGWMKHYHTCWYELDLLWMDWYLSKHTKLRSRLEKVWNGVIVVLGLSALFAVLRKV